jgi:hypothetical protein
MAHQAENPEGLVFQGFQGFFLTFSENVKMGKLGIFWVFCPILVMSK